MFPSWCIIDMWFRFYGQVCMLWIYFFVAQSPWSSHLTLAWIINWIHRFSSFSLNFELVMAETFVYQIRLLVESPRSMCGKCKITMETPLVHHKVVNGELCFEHVQHEIAANFRLQHISSLPQATCCLTFFFPRPQRFLRHFVNSPNRTPS